MDNMSIDKLTAIGGNEWRGGDHHRIYFNDLAGLYGLRYGRYNTGNISWAKLNGEEISNSRARRILGRLYGSLWYDVNRGEFGWQYLSDETAETIISEIKRRVENG